MSAVDTATLVSFLSNQRRVLDHLRRRRLDLQAEIGQLQAELEIRRRQVDNLVEQLRRHGRSRVEWGDFRRLTPVSPVWSADHARPIDRYYIEQFVAAHSGDIRGTVLEVRDAKSTVRFGGDRVQSSELIAINQTSQGAAIIAGLRRASAMRAHSFDCVIMTQSLHVIYDMRAALAECVSILKPGGTLLATLPCVERLSPAQGLDGDFWRFTAAAARRLFGEFFPSNGLEVRSYGNVLTSLAYLYGLTCHELEPFELEAHDPYFPLMVAVRAAYPGLPTDPRRRGGTAEDQDR